MSDQDNTQAASEPEQVTYHLFGEDGFYVESVTLPATHDVPTQSTLHAPKPGTKAGAVHWGGQRWTKAKQPDREPFDPEARPTVNLGEKDPEKALEPVQDPS